MSAALEAGAPIVDVLVAEGGRAEAIDAQAVAASVPVTRLPARDLDRIGDAQTSQGVVAVAESVVRDHLGEVEGAVLLLNGVQDPGNVGAIVRSAAWFGVRAVVADADCADFEGPKAVRASMGGLWDLDLVRVPSLDTELARLAASGIDVWGADLDGTALADWRPAPTDALVLGSEAHGLSDTVRQRLAGAVSIPGGGAGRGVESLNVAVAAGVLIARWRS